MFMKFNMQISPPVHRIFYAFFLKNLKRETYINSIHNAVTTWEKTHTYEL
jgi:hypothetical protein